MKSILPIIGHDYDAGEKPARKEIQLAIAYINSHLNKAAITVKEIAEHANVSQDTLENMFKKWNEYTVVQYVLEVRLHEKKKNAYTIG